MLTILDVCILAPGNFDFRCSTSSKERLHLESSANWLTDAGVVIGPIKASVVQNDSDEVISLIPGQKHVTSRHVTSRHVTSRHSQIEPMLCSWMVDIEQHV